MEMEMEIGDWVWDRKNKIIYGPHYGYIFIDLRSVGHMGYWHLICPY